MKCLTTQERTSVLTLVNLACHNNWDNIHGGIPDSWAEFGISIYEKLKRDLENYSRICELFNSLGINDKGVEERTKWIQSAIAERHLNASKKFRKNKKKGRK